MLEEKKTVIWENVFLFGFALIILILFKKQTMFDMFEIPKYIKMVAVLVTFAAGISNIILYQYKNLKKADTVLLFIVTISFAASLIVIPRYSVLSLLVLLIGAKGISFKKILKVYLYVIGFALMFTLVMALGGQIKNLVYYQANRDFDRRISFGMIYPSYFSKYVFAIAACCVWYRGNKISYPEIILIILSALVCSYFCVSRTELILQIFLAVVAIVMKHTKKVECVENIEQHGLVISLAMSMIPFFIMLMSIGSAVFYNPDFAFFQKIDNIFSGRLYYSHKALTDYAITPFGQNVIINSNEGHTAETLDYFMIDSSYISILQELGIITLIVVILIFSYIIFQKSRQQEWGKICVLTIILILCMSHPDLLNVSIVPFVLLIAADDSEHSEVVLGKKKTTIIWSVVVCTFVVGIVVGRIILKDSGRIIKLEYQASKYGISPGDGDCTNVLQQLIDDIYYAGGGTIVLEDGEYNCSGIILRDTVSLQGAGKNHTILKQNEYAEKDGNFIYIENIMDGLCISDLTICGNCHDNGGIGLYLETDYHPEERREYQKVRKLSPEDMEIIIQDVQICHFANDGCFIGAGNDYVVLSNSRFQENGANGMKLLTSGSRITECDFYRNKQSGIIISGEDNMLEFIYSSENGTEDKTAWGIYVFASDCELQNIETVQNLCGGINITGDNNNVAGLVSRDNGTEQYEGDMLVYIEGKNNQVEGICMESSQKYPLVEYALADLSEDGNISITIEKNSAKNNYK